METEIILDHLISPTHLTKHPQTGHLYIADQPGYIYRDDELWLDLTNLVIPLQPSGDESGLLSLEFSPDGKYLYLFSSRRKETLPQDMAIYTPRGVDVIDHVDVLSMIPVNGRRHHHQPDEERYYFGIARNTRVHHGGKLAFGADGYLYLSTGDGGPQKDPYSHAQDLSSPLGKILRLSISPEEFNIPSDNPFLSSSSFPLIYAYGFRNPWSLTLSPDGKNFFIGDVGYERREEVDILVKGGNYGWNIKEGIYFTPWSTSKEREKGKLFIDPIFDYPHRIEGPSAIIGGYYVDNKYYPEGYYFADFQGPLMRIKQVNGHDWQLMDTWNLPSPHRQINAWGYDQDYLYLLTKGSEGRVERIINLT